MRCRKRRRWGAKRQAATCVAEDFCTILFLPRAGGSLASAPPSEGIHALVLSCPRYADTSSDRHKKPAVQPLNGGLCLGESLHCPEVGAGNELGVG